MHDVPEKARAAFTADAALVAALAGGFFFHTAGNSPTYPYVLLTLAASGTGPENTFGTSYREEPLYQLSVVAAPYPEEATRLMESVAELFDGLKVTLASGAVATFTRRTPVAFIDFDATTSEGKKLYQAFATYGVSAQRHYARHRPSCPSA